MTELTADHWLTRAVGHEPKRIVYSAEVIAHRVHEIAEEISNYYPPDEDLLVLGLLKGSFIFLSDLVRAINRPLHVDFIVAWFALVYHCATSQCRDHKFSMQRSQTTSHRAPPATFTATRLSPVRRLASISVSISAD